MSKNVLIAGGSGSIGNHLTELFRQSGYNVSWLSTGNVQKDGVQVYKWDPSKNSIDSKALEGIHYLVNLAGAGIADKKWDKDRKKLLKESRINSTELLLQKVIEIKPPLKAYISASAIGYYGYDSGSIEKKEGSRFGDDFLATLTKEWEIAADGFAKAGIRTVKFRTGLVLSNDKGLWPRFEKIIKLGLAAPLGSGEQYMSWIHMDDLCRIYLNAIENEKMEGVYNAVAPNPVSNKEFTREGAKALKKPFFLPNVPGFIIKLVYGELASALLGSSRVSSEKIVSEGFEFTYPTLEDAFKSLTHS